jgi:tetratricopeptide (TPR) repeat protein
LFWPFVALTGHYLSDRQAVTIFCAIGILASVGLLRALWRRYFAEVSVGVVVVCALALGLATGVPAMLPRSEVHEVATSCGYMLTMLALAAIWCALHEPERRCRWLTMASVAYGLAVGARPSLLFGAVILLMPVAQAWREPRPEGLPRSTWLSGLLAATGPILLIGLGLMLYNALRFDNPFEFGVHYQLAGKRQVTMQFFSLRYLWFNFRVYFLEPARWSGRFPFVHEIAVPPLPTGYYGAEDPFGILTNVPLVWLALAVPLAWRSRSGQAGSILRWFVTAVALLFGICALTVGTFIAASMRYAVDFLPALLLLAVIGILGLERALADRPVWRRAARWGWGVLLGFSVTFNLLVSVVNYGHAGCGLAGALAVEGRVPEAIQIFEKALRISPDDADGHDRLAHALLQAGKVREAIGHYEQALRIKPDYAGAHNDMGTIYWAEGKLSDAIGHYEQALRIKPDFAEPHYNLGVALAQAGRIPEAIEHLEQSLRFKPDLAEAHYALGLALEQAGRVGEAIGHFEQALRLKPDYAEAHYDLGFALLQLDRIQEAIGHFEQAVRIKPDYLEAHYDLAVALEEAGRPQDAIGHYEQALRIKPDLTQAQNALARLQGGQ